MDIILTQFKQSLTDKYTYVVALLGFVFMTPILKYTLGYELLYPETLTGFIASLLGSFTGAVIVYSILGNPYKSD